MKNVSSVACKWASLMVLALASPSFLSAETAQDRVQEQDGSYHYLTGELDFISYTTLNRAVDAVHAALEELKLVVTNHSMNDALTARIDAHRPGEDSKVAVTLKQLPARESGRERVEIVIHVGAFGDKERAQLIKQRIEAKLAAPVRNAHTR